MLSEVLLVAFVAAWICAPVWFGWIQKRGGEALLFAVGFFCLLVFFGYVWGYNLGFPAGRWGGLAVGIVGASWLCRGMLRDALQKVKQARMQAYLTEEEQAARTRLASRGTDGGMTDG